jgi:hypothetical protein
MLPTLDAEELRVMIECRRQPSCRRMTRFARVTQIERRMIPRCRDGKVRLMTLIAVRVHELVIAAHVAANAGGGRMLPCQRELRRRMIERSGFPRRRGMALRACLREQRCSMIWIRCSIVVGQMARAACCQESHVLAILVAVSAYDREMGAGQRKFRCGMIEACRLPRRSRVTPFARQWKSRRRMIWIHRICVLSLMTRHALG